MTLGVERAMVSIDDVQKAIKDDAKMVQAAKMDQVQCWQALKLDQQNRKGRSRQRCRQSRQQQFQSSGSSSRQMMQRHQERRRFQEAAVPGSCYAMVRVAVANGGRTSGAKI